MFTFSFPFLLFSVPFIFFTLFFPCSCHPSPSSPSSSLYCSPSSLLFCPPTPAYFASAPLLYAPLLFCSPTPAYLDICFPSFMLICSSFSSAPLLPPTLILPTSFYAPCYPFSSPPLLPATLLLILSFILLCSSAPLLPPVLFFYSLLLPYFRLSCFMLPCSSFVPWGVPPSSAPPFSGFFPPTSFALLLLCSPFLRFPPSFLFCSPALLLLCSPFLRFPPSYLFCTPALLLLCSSDPRLFPFFSPLSSAFLSHHSSLYLPVFLYRFLSFSPYPPPLPAPCILVIP